MNLRLNVQKRGNAPLCFRNCPTLPERSPSPEDKRPTERSVWGDLSMNVTGSNALPVPTHPHHPEGVPELR